MLTGRDILTWVILIPAAIAAVVMLVALLIERRTGARQTWGAALAVGAGFLAGFTALTDVGPFPPVRAQSWLVYLGAASVAAALIGMLSGRAARVAWRLFSIALLVAMAWLLTRPLAQRVEAGEYWRAFAVFALGAAAWWGLMEPLAPRVPAAGLALLLAGWAGAAGVVLLDSSSVVLGQLAWSTSAALAAVALASGIGRDVSLSRGAMLAVTITLGGLLLCGHLFADLTRWDLAWLAAAPLLLWIGELRMLKRPAARWTVRAIVLLAALAVPLVAAIIGLRRTMLEQTEGYLY